MSRVLSTVLCLGCSLSLSLSLSLSVWIFCIVESRFRVCSNRVAEAENYVGGCANLFSYKRRIMYKFSKRGQSIQTIQSSHIGCSCSCKGLIKSKFKEAIVQYFWLLLRCRWGVCFYRLYTAYIGSCLMTFRDSVLVPSSRVLRQAVPKRRSTTTNPRRVTTQISEHTEAAVLLQSRKLRNVFSTLQRCRNRACLREFAEDHTWWRVIMINRLHRKSKYNVLN